MNERAHGVMFHHFHDNEKHPKGQGSISKEQFRKIIICLQENYNLLSAREWFDKSVRQELGSHDIAITFDDNLLCQFEIALPVLEEFDIKAFWFIYSSPLVGVKEKLEIYRYFRSVKFKTIDDFYQSFNKKIESSELREEVKDKLSFFNADEFLKGFPFYTLEDKIFRYIRSALGQEKYYKLMDEMIKESDLDIDEISNILWNTQANIKYLNDTGHIIGLHTHTHPTDLRLMSYSKQLEDYEKNMQILTSITGSEIYAMSHPCNSYNDDTLAILKKMKVNFGFRANMEPGYESSLEYPRIDHALLINKII